MARRAVGNSSGMYPAIEIDLHLIVSAQLSDRVRPSLRPRFGPLYTWSDEEQPCREAEPN